MHDADSIEMGATALSCAVFAGLVAYWPGLVGPWFLLVAALTNGFAWLGIGWDAKETDLLIRLSQVNRLLLLPIWLPVFFLLTLITMGEDEDADE